MVGIETWLLEFIRSTYNAIQWPGVVLLMAIESAMIPLPSELVMPLSGWMLIREKGLGIQYVLAAGFYGALGNLIGSVIGYWTGALGGRPLLERYGRFLLISRRDLAQGEQWFAKYGSAAVFFSRLLPVVRTFISFPAGVARMPFGKFCIYTFAGSFPWSVGLAYGGYYLGEHWEQLRAVMRPFDIPIIIAIIILVALYLRQRAREAFSQK